MRKFPLGLKSAKTGVLFPILSKSSRDKSTFASWAIPSKCKTALVDPPKAITTAIAFSKASFVMISRGLISFEIKFIIASPAL